jgi:hypothetical protein
MDLSADVMCDKANDAFAVSRRQNRAGVGQPGCQAVDPQPPVWIEHHLDDGGIFQKRGDVRPERRAQHTGTARGRVRSA